MKISIFFKLYYDGFALICVEDPKMVQKLKSAAFKGYTEKRKDLWRRAVKFEKYGKSFCNDIDANNLLYASSIKPSISCFGVFLSLLLIFVNL